MASMRRAFVVTLLCVPFLLRLGYFLETRHQPYFQWNFLVAYVNHTFAADLAQGRGAPYTLYRSPWYPLALSCVYRLVGVEPMVVRIIQWCLGGLSCLIVYRLAGQLLGRRSAFVVLLFAGLFVPAVCYEGELIEQALAMPLMLAGVAILAGAWRGMNPSAGALAGSLCCGAGALMRPDLLLSIPFLLAAMALERGTWGDRVKRLVAFGAGFAVMLVPLWRPSVLLDVRGDETRINAAINFYLGNNPHADGYNARFHETRELATTDPAARADHMTGLDLAGIRHARSRTRGDLSTVAPFWVGQATDFIRDDPGGYAMLLLRKTALHFNGYLLGTQKDLYFLRESSAILSALLWCVGLCFPLGLILPLAAVGIGYPLEPSKGLMLLSVPAGCLATTLIFFHDARFQMPAWPFWILFAAAGASRLIEAARARRWLAPAVFVMSVILANIDWLGTHVVRRAAEEFRVGTMFLDAGDTARALAAYRRSIQADPSYVPSLDNLVSVATQTGGLDTARSFLQATAESGSQTPQLARAIAQVELAAGRPEAAIETLRSAIARFHEDLALALDLAGLLMPRGDCVEALALARRALERTQEDPRAHAYAGYCLSSLGRHEEAADLLQQGRARHPGDITLIGLLAEAMGALGRRADERALYREVLGHDPSNAMAAYGMARSLVAEGLTSEALPYARQAERLGHPMAAGLVRDLESHPPR